ncbi:MAG: aldo/keto reductase [Spirochaetaceae bacterium]|nr:MAG: aldo/keto reductase [Spirochaetaceae bacterium]
MEYRRLGRSGLRVSPLVLGTMNFGGATDRDQSFRIIDEALEAGINLFDCADIYSGGESERVLGEALSRNGKRKHALITSKAFMPSGPGPNDRGSSRHHIFESCENSLKSLKTDYIDIYFIHRSDFSVSPEEPLAALDILVKQGKIRYAACSTHPSWRTVEALMTADRLGYPKFICEQPPYNLLDRRIEQEILPMCRYFDLGVICWSPLAQGTLAGRYTKADQFPAGSRATQKEVYAERITQAGIDAAAKMAVYAGKKGVTPAQFAVAWVLNQPGVTGSLIGPRTLEQFRDLLPSAAIELTEEDRSFCDSLVPPRSHLSNHFNTTDWMK